MPPFAPLGPLGRFPRFVALTAALRLPVARPAHLRLRHRSVATATERTGSPKVSRCPSHACLGPTLRRTLQRKASGADSPYVSRLRHRLPSTPTRRRPLLLRFRSLPHGPPARCLRFAAPVARSPRKTRFRLTALSWPDGIRTRWVALPGFVTWLASHGFLQVETYLAHGELEGSCTKLHSPRREVPTCSVARSRPRRGGGARLRLTRVTTKLRRDFALRLRLRLRGFGVGRIRR